MTPPGIWVLGCAGSGTSALAGMLEALGVDMGDTETDAGRGHGKFYRTNEDINVATISSWPELVGYIRKRREAATGPWGFKRPTLVAFPFPPRGEDITEQLSDGGGLMVRCVHISRPLGERFAGCVSRDEDPQVDAEIRAARRLWMAYSYGYVEAQIERVSHVLGLEWATTYADLKADPLGAARSLAWRLGLPDDRCEAAAATISEYVPCLESATS